MSHRTSIRFYNFLSKAIRPIEIAALVKTLLLVKRKIFLVNNFRFYIDPVSNFGIRLINDRIYEPEITSKILDTLSPGDIFVDLGANEGYFSILAASKVGTVGKVIAIEPQRRLWNVIMENIQLNNLTNIQLMPFAAAEKEKDVKIILTPGLNTGSSGIVRSYRNWFWRTQRVKSLPLDQLIGNQKIKLLKVDIEGYEFFALSGASDLLKKRLIENMIIEFHPEQLRKLGHSVEKIVILLEASGYKQVDGIYRLMY